MAYQRLVWKHFFDLEGIISDLSSISWIELIFPFQDWRFLVVGLPFFVGFVDLVMEIILFSFSNVHHCFCCLVRKSWWCPGRKFLSFNIFKKLFYFSFSATKLLCPIDRDVIDKARVSQKCLFSINFCDLWKYESMLALMKTT